MKRDKKNRFLFEIILLLIFFIVLLGGNYFSYTKLFKIKTKVHSIESQIEYYKKINLIISKNNELYDSITRYLLGEININELNNSFSIYEKFIQTTSFENISEIGEINSLYRQTKKFIENPDSRDRLIEIKNKIVFVNKKLRNELHSYEIKLKRKFNMLTEDVSKEEEIKFYYLLTVLLIFIFIFYFIKFRFIKLYSTVIEVIERLSSKDIAFFKSEENMNNIKKKLGVTFFLFNKIIDMMASFIERLKSSGVELSRITFLISESTKQQSSAISEQAASINQVTASLEELSITAKEIADIARMVDKSATETRATAKNGVDLIVKIIDSVNSLKETISTTAEKNIEVVKRSKEIDKILEIMDSLVSEIHLLALNASIESASAGEFGKRFGAIAQEIRELADNSRESIDKIKNYIFSFHEAINSAVMSIEYSKKEAEKTKKTVEEAGEYFERIFANIEQTNLYSKQISSATEQQKIAGEQIVNVIRDINSALNVSSTEIEKVNQSLNKLLEISLTINGIVHTFKVEDKINPRKILEDIVNYEALKELEMEEIGAFLENILSFNPFLEAVFVTDAKGILLEAKKAFYVEEDLSKFIGKNFSEREWFKGAIESKEIYMTQPYVSYATNELCITFSAPVFDSSGTIVAIVGIDVNHKKWIEGENL